MPNGIPEGVAPEQLAYPSPGQYGEEQYGEGAPAATPIPPEIVNAALRFLVGTTPQEAREQPWYKTATDVGMAVGPNFVPPAKLAALGGHALTPLIAALTKRQILSQISRPAVKETMGEFLDYVPQFILDKLKGFREVPTSKLPAYRGVYLPLSKEIMVTVPKEYKSKITDKIRASLFQPTDSDIIWAIKHEFAHHFEEFMGPRDVLNIVKRMKDLGIRVNSEDIMKGLFYIKREPSMKQREAFARTLSELSPGEMAYVMQDLFERVAKKRLIETAETAGIAGTTGAVGRAGVTEATTGAATGATGVKEIP
jgi:hypothetical protein